MDDEMVGKNHEHCNDAQQFYAGITPTLFKIRVDGLALWEAVVSETIIVSPSFFSYSLVSFQYPPHRGFYPPGKTELQSCLRSATGPQTADDF